MSLLRKLSNVLKEIFWIKPSKKKSSPRLKVSAKRTIKKKSPIKKIPQGLQVDSNLVKVGEITHYFDRIKVCVVKVMHGTILIGDKLTIAGLKERFIQKVWSMQIESEDVKIAKKGQLIGLKVDKAVRVGDIVYK